MDATVLLGQYRADRASRPSREVGIGEGAPVKSLRIAHAGYQRPHVEATRSHREDSRDGKAASLCEKAQHVALDRKPPVTLPIGRKPGNPIQRQKGGPTILAGLEPDLA